MKKSKKIIKFLGGRKGFEWWWHDIDKETKKEILDGIEKIVREK